jgi:hypothetical protein
VTFAAVPAVLVLIVAGIATHRMLEGGGLDHLEARAKQPDGLGGRGRVDLDLLDQIPGHLLEDRATSAAMRTFASRTSLNDMRSKTSSSVKMPCACAVAIMRCRRARKRLTKK